MNHQHLASLKEIETHALDNHSMLVSKTNFSDSVLYFHGFPGPYDQTAPSELRIADQLFAIIAKKHKFFYPLYTTKSTPFNFSDALKDGQSAYSYLRQIRPTDTLTIIGQSWGANLALQLAQHIEIERLILIVPFLFLPTGESARRMVRSYSDKFPELIPSERIDLLTAQIEDLARHSPPAKLLKNLNIDVTLIAAANDELIPIKAVKSLVDSNGGTNINLIVLNNQTHSIEDRQMLWDVFRKVFS